MQELGNELLRMRTALADGRSVDLENSLAVGEGLARAKLSEGPGWRVWRLDPVLVYVIAQIILAIIELIRQNRKLARRLPAG